MDISFVKGLLAISDAYNWSNRKQVRLTCIEGNYLIISGNNIANSKVFSLVLTAVFLIPGLPVLADDDRGWKFWGSEQSSHDVAPVDNKVYREECGSCHFAYQPGILPSASWKKIMNGLEKHFGDNAELDAQVRQSLTEYLVSNASDVVRSKFSRWTRGDAPMRITETSKFRHEHDEFPRAVIKNEKIRSLANCIACHTRADTGSFDENQIKIPGIGRWED